MDFIENNRSLVRVVLNLEYFLNINKSVMESFKTFDNDMNKGKAETLKNIKNKKLFICIIVLIALVLFFIGFVEVQRYIFFHPWNNVAAYEQLKEIQ
jgi:hypothetical protein